MPKPRKEHKTSTGPVVITGEKKQEDNKAKKTPTKQTRKSEDK